MPTSQISATYYQAHSQTQQNFADEVIVLHNFKSNERILDIGCGHGAITSRLAALVPNGTVHGIDPSEDMILYAKKHSITDHLSFALGSAEDFHGSACYTLITAFNCLHWVKHVTKAFNHMHKALPQGGRLLALTYPKDSDYWAAFTDTLVLPQWHKLAKTSICSSWLTYSDYLLLIEKTGFKILNAHCFAETITYPNQQTFKEYVNGWLPCLVNGTKTELAQFLDAVTCLTWERYKITKGCTIPYKKIHLYLEKI